MTLVRNTSQYPRFSTPPVWDASPLPTALKLMVPYCESKHHAINPDRAKQLEPGLLNPESRKLAMRPLHLPNLRPKNKILT